jgi:PAS domain-containing protein
MVFERIGDPLLLLDSTGYILDFNPAARKVLDIGESEHITDVVSLEKSFVFDAVEMLALLAR